MQMTLVNTFKENSIPHSNEDDENWAVHRCRLIHLVHAFPLRQSTNTMINGRIVGAELREVPPERLPVWGQRWTNPRRALGPSQGYKHEFRLDGDTEGISVLTLNVPNELLVTPNTEHDHSISSSFPPSLLFAPCSRFDLTFGDSLHQDVLATPDTSNYADHLDHADCSQQQSSLLNMEAFSNRFIEEMPELSNRSGFRFDSRNQDDHQITPNNFGALSAHDPSLAGVARRPLTFPSDRQFPAHTRIAFSCRVPTTIPEGESMQWSTSLPHENISRGSPALSLQYDSPVISSFGGYTIPPHLISGTNAAWHNQANEATLGPALWGPPDLSTLSANGAPVWPAGYGPVPQSSTVLSQSSGSICPIIPDFDPLRLSPLEVGLYDFPSFGAE